MDMPKWLSGPRPRMWAHKTDVPDLASPRRVNFGLAGWAWCRMRGDTVEMEGGQWMPIHEAYLHVGWYIGPRDLTAADRYTHNPELIVAWRNSVADRIASDIIGAA